MQSIWLMKFCMIENAHNFSKVLENNPNIKGKIYIFSELDFNAHNFKQKKGISKKVIWLDVTCHSLLVVKLFRTEGSAFLQTSWEKAIDRKICKLCLISSNVKTRYVCLFYYSLNWLKKRMRVYRFFGKYPRT